MVISALLVFRVGLPCCPRFSGFGLPPFPGFPFRGSLSICHPMVKELTGSPKFSDVSLHTYRALYSGRPSETSPFFFRSLCVGFWFRHTIVVCFDNLTKLLRASAKCGFACGLCDSLSTLQLCHCFHSCKTRYELMVSHYSTGSFTLQETPSFSWRTSQ